MQIFLRAGFVLFTGFCFTFVEAAGQTAKTQALTPGAPIAREPSGRQPHSYEIVLEAGQFTIVTVKQQHAPANVSIRDPFGRKTFELYVEKVAIFAEATGRYLIQVLAPAGPYEIRVEPPRLARAQDKARAAAEQTLSEGRRLALQADRSSMQEALEKFKVARALFRDADYPSGEGLSLVWIGDASLQLENRTQPARDHYNEALALARAIDDRRLEAEALLALGISYPNVVDQPRALEYFEQALTLFEAVDNRRGQAVALTCIQLVWIDLGE